jgi:Arc/MetJ-type ribon-helix-helix transcriptional regulator
MTDMKRITVSMPDEMVEALDVLKRSDEFAGKPYSEIIRTLIQIGLDRWKKGGRKCQSLARKSERALSG